MTKTDTALRVELEDLKNQIYDLDKKVSLEKKRTDRIVQVLLNTLPKETLNGKVTFIGRDCHDNYQWWMSGEGRTLREFLTYIIDP